jgi:hypothetical protein
MSRLLDRILTSCRRFRPSMLEDEAERRAFEAKALDQVRQKLGPHLPEHVVARVRARVGEPISTEDAPLSELEGIPVIAADDVAAYVRSLEVGTELPDLVASMAPPFNQFFIEFQQVPDAPGGLYAWGHHFTVFSDPEDIAAAHPCDDGYYPRWVYQIETYLERRKGEPCGPAAVHLCGLAEDGTWLRHSKGKLYWEGRFVSMSAEPPEDATREWVSYIAQTVFPALMALSFMHCKNVSLESVVPSEKLSRSYRKRHGRPLLSYGELRTAGLWKVKLFPTQVLCPRLQCRTLFMDKVVSLIDSHDTAATPGCMPQH